MLIQTQNELIRIYDLKEIYIERCKSLYVLRYRDSEKTGVIYCSFNQKELFQIRKKIIMAYENGKSKISV